VKRSDNRRLRSVPFDEKREVLRQQGFMLTTIIAEKAKWGAEEIEWRQALMADLAERVWPLPKPPKPKRSRPRQTEDIAEAAFRIVQEATDG
jgi:Ser/Thr protein kinase RdoA (MazF antagonist)